MWRLIRQLFSAPPAPVSPIQDDFLGQLEWSEDADGWQVEYGGLTVILAGTRAPEPSQRLREYAKTLLQDGCAKLQAGLADAKMPALARYPAHLSQEISCLYYLDLSVYETKDPLRSILSLGPENDYRFWRIEFEGARCDGLGFDT